MDDYSISSLTESKNEWCARLVNTLTPAIIAGIKSIFDEAYTLCRENDEEDKYLMTFQTFLSRVPKWNSTIIENETKRIVEVSSCSYLEDLITCVHVIQLKALTCIRVGQQQKKIDINIPSLTNFIHKVYVNVARKVYTNVYLFEKGIAPLQIQKHNRELEVIIRECIMNTIRDTIPVEEILKAYMSETTEEEVEVHEEIVEKPAPEENTEKLNSQVAETNERSETAEENTVNETKREMEENTVIDRNEKQIKNTSVGFSDVDKALELDTGKEIKINAPKTIERLEQISFEANERRKAEKAEESEDEDGPLKIGDEVKLELDDVDEIKNEIQIEMPPALEIETLS
jgi:hypothetical protein